MNLGDNQIYMERCFTLAKNGRGRVSPNPMVGAVIVKNGQIIGEGYHANYGESHAEVVAIDQVRNKEELKESTLYVNLEPCSHYGNTPPCSKKIIDSGIPEVVIGCRDESEKVSGKGIEEMENAGIKVATGVCEGDARFLNRRFLTYHNKKRPYVILKWAQTADGFLADNSGYSKWISNSYSRIYVHKWRAEEDSIMVGYNTAELDNPALTAREWIGKSPLRVFTDPELTLPKSSSLLDNHVETWIINEKTDKQKGNSNFVRMNLSEKWLDGLLARLYESGYGSLIVEGGKKLLKSFVKAGLWDEARIFTSTVIFKEGLKAPKLKNGELLNIQEIGNDELKWFVKKETTK